MLWCAPQAEEERASVSISDCLLVFRLVILDLLGPGWNLGTAGDARNASHAAANKQVRRFFAGRLPRSGNGINRAS